MMWSPGGFPFVCVYVFIFIFCATELSRSDPSTCPILRGSVPPEAPLLANPRSLYTFLRFGGSLEEKARKTFRQSSLLVCNQGPSCLGGNCPAHFTEKDCAPSNCVFGRWEMRMSNLQTCVNCRVLSFAHRGNANRFLCRFHFQDGCSPDVKWLVSKPSSPHP